MVAVTDIPKEIHKVVPASTLCHEKLASTFSVHRLRTNRQASARLEVYFDYFKFREILGAGG